MNISTTIKLKNNLLLVSWLAGLDKLVWWSASQDQFKTSLKPANQVEKTSSPIWACLSGLLNINFSLIYYDHFFLLCFVKMNCTKQNFTYSNLNVSDGHDGLNTFLVAKGDLRMPSYMPRIKE